MSAGFREVLELLHHGDMHIPTALVRRSVARRAGVAALVFLSSLSMFLQTFGGVFYSLDEELYFRITYSLAEEGSFAITPVEYAPTFSVAQGRDGQMYANRGPGLPLTAVPAYFAGRLLYEAAGDKSVSIAQSSIDHPTGLTVTLTLLNTVVVSAMVVILFLIIVRLGYSDAIGVLVSLLFAFGTMAWTYASRSFYAEPLLALCCLIAFYCAIVHRQTGGTLPLVGAGTALGWGILTKITAFAMIPFLALYIAWPKGERGARSIAPSLAIFLVALSPYLLFLGSYNYQHFGNPLVTGYELEGAGKSLIVSGPVEFAIGLAGIMFAPGKGLLIFAAPAALGFLCAKLFGRKHPAEAVLIYGFSAATIGGIVLWRDWTGGWCWGPRLILNTVPFLVIPLATIFSRWRDLGRLARTTVLVLIAASVFIQAVGALSNQLSWYLQVGNYELVYYSPGSSPVVGHLLQLVEGGSDLFWDKTEMLFPGHSQVFSVLRWVLGAVAVVSTASLVRLVCPVSPKRY